MTGESYPIALLRHLVPPLDGGERGAIGVKPVELVLSATVTVIGRDPACQVVIDSQHYGMVSRRHLELRYAAAQSSESPWGWWVCDLNSANGTFVNGQQLQGCQRLQVGDRIVLGRNGPEFCFELPVLTMPPDLPAAMLPRSGQTVPIAIETPVAAMVNATTPTPDLTLTQLFPIFSSGLDLHRKAYLMPGAVAVTFVVALFMAIEQPILFNILLASFLAIACYYVIYQLCGKPKPAGLLLGTAITTVLLLRSPVLSMMIVLFRQILPGDVSTDQPSFAFPVQLVKMFFGAGLMEELLKALPLFAVMALTQRFNSAAKQSYWGIVEPLDGILLGAASAIGFTMSETLGQYVPEMVQNAQLQAGVELSQLRGLQLLIPRLLGSISGHMAYSGYFGYFIGLAVLRRRWRWQIMLVGYVTAAALHALWNTMGAVSPMLLALVGMLSYAFLAAAIVKARSLSPNRSANFATQLNRSERSTAD
jgi:RsiW-degrading membrane proteinase PrsW (M82 family)